MMKYFSIPSDFKIETLAEIDRLHHRYPDAQVVECYGQLTEGFILNSGRVIADIPKVSLFDLETYVNECKKYGIRFNYTLNASCLSNMEFTEAGIQQITSLLTSLREIGITDITAALPPVIEMIQSVADDFTIKASAICEVASPAKALFYKNLGVERIVVDPDITRNFAVLKNITKAFEGPVEIIVNNVCYKSCAYKKFHYNHDAHATGLNRANEVITDYYINRCSMQKSNHFVNPIKLNWIRPEDLSYYEDAQIHHFKIQGRQNLMKGNLLRTLEAYMKMDFDGNLFDLITLFAPYNSFQTYIDNKKLEGFLEPFVKNKNFCQEMCDICTHCTRFAEKSMEREKAEALNQKSLTFFQEYDKFGSVLKEKNQNKVLLTKNQFNFE